MFTKVASIASAVLLTACAAQTPEGPAQKEIEQKEIMPLAGSEWATDIEGQFIQFGAEGKVSGNGGCNRFGGAYTQDGTALSFGPLMSTKMACMILSDEQKFFDVLANTKQAEITHLTLVLKDEAGDVLASLVRSDWD